MDSITAKSEKAPETDEVQEKHADLINGLQLVYKTLADLQLISANQIINPPSYPGHNMQPASLHAFGYNEETVALIQRLPWLADEIVHPWEGHAHVVAPFGTTAMNYFSTAGGNSHMTEDFEHPRRGGYCTDLGERDLEPYMLRITNGNWVYQDGYHYIYNSRDCLCFCVIVIY
jgi:hypothetical protein